MIYSNDYTFENNNNDKIYEQKVMIMCEKLEEDECAKGIIGYDDLFDKRYAITDKAQVYSFLIGNFLIPQIGKNGYYHVCLSDKYGRVHNIELHRLVALAWCDGYRDGLEVLHVDGTQPLNCLPSNLKWGTHKENCEDPIRNAKISAALKKPVICIETGQVYESALDASVITGVNRNGISQVCNGKAKRAGGYHWAFYDIGVVC